MKLEERAGKIRKILRETYTDVKTQLDFSTPFQIEFDLMEIVPKNDWDGFSLRLIYFGREFCRARKPVCEKCPICDLFFFPDKTV